ncbi:BnaA04g16400D [Brassica napus]|uniref:BnaA04g16400D protein n=1 Tax=Brassica napus TaxID=3708 RepID=A0A078H106_BRANA|nr:BnaA04g16400D [Brassica napus]
MVKPCFHVSSISCFLCCLFVSSFFVNSLVSQPFRRPDQIEILLAFKNEFPILKCDFKKWPSSRKLTKSWTRNDVKSFSGVFFDSETGVVTVLKMRGACLSGTLNANSSLFRLHHLRYLDLSQNSFDSFPFLPQLGKLKNLESLDLSHMGLPGEIPSSISSLNRLTKLDLSDNELTGTFSPLLNLSRLSSLSLSNNLLLNPGSPNLKELVLNNCNIEDFEGSPRMLLNSSLRSLDLRSNAFQGSFPVISPVLSYVLASDNSFTGEIPLSLCNQISYLRVLDLAHNNFSGSIPRCLITLVQDLDLGNNNLIGRLPDLFYKGGSLRTLDGNRITDTFPFWLEELPNLKIIVLRSNMFHGPIYSPQHPLSFPELRMFDISRNNFTGSLPHDYFVNWSTPLLSAPQKVSQPLYMGDPFMYDYYPSMYLRNKGINMELEKIFLAYTSIDPKSSFEGNLNLCGRPLLESCFQDKVPSTPEAQELEPSKQEQVFNWKAAAMGYGPGVLFGLAIGQVLYSYKPVLFFKLFRL